MKPARIIVLIIALGAGGGAAMLASHSNKPKKAPTTNTVEMSDVLVAKAAIGIGDVVTGAVVRWQPWPAKAVAPDFMRRSAMPNAVERLKGAIARYPIAAGEPIIESRLVKPHGSGFMAAILPSGMRAISTNISAESGAGGFILPNDRVDVILTRNEKGKHSDHLVSQTILRNVKVLAIDQNIAEKGGKKVVVGKTATLELTSGQAETLALGHQQGKLSLALRSLADAHRPEDTGDARRRGIYTVRFGVSTTNSVK